jgi:hypothetical protein
MLAVLIANFTSDWLKPGNINAAFFYHNVCRAGMQSLSRMWLSSCARHESRLNLTNITQASQCSACFYRLSYQPVSMPTLNNWTKDNRSTDAATAV